MPIPDTNILRNAIPQSNFDSSQLPTIPDPNSINNNFLENSFDKTLKVIQSCTTEKHLESALKMVNNFKILVSARYTSASTHTK